MISGNNGISLEMKELEIKTIIATNGKYEECYSYGKKGKI